MSLRETQPPINVMSTDQTVDWPADSRPLRPADHWPSRSLSHVELIDLVRRWTHGAIRSDVLRSRADNDRLVLRVGDDQGTIVLKLWSRPGLRGSVRRLTRTASVFWEWRNLRRLERCGVACPKPLACCVLGPNSSAYTEALAVEDLGPLVGAMDHVSALLATGDELALTVFESHVLGLTRSLLAAGVVDADHSLMNMALTGDGKLVRLDFELARPAIFPALMPERFGRMLGRLVASYAFAVQPDLSRAERFAARLARELQPGRRVLARARAYVTKAFERQLARGIDHQLRLEW